MDSSDLSYQPMEKPQNKRAPHRWRRATGVALVCGAVVGGLAVTHSQTAPTTAGAAAAVSSTTALTVANTTTTPPTQQGFKGGPGLFGRPGHGGMGPRGERGLTVTAVSGNTITASGPFSRTVSITVTGSTTYTEAGASVSLTAVHSGEQIAVRGTRTAQGVLTATNITILLPTEAGVVTNVSGSTVTITGFNGTTHTVTLTGATRYDKAGQTASSTDITNGVAIVAEGTLNSDGSLTAEQVSIQLPRVMGQVSAVNNGTYTITDRRGNGTLTVVTTNTTVYVNPDGSTAQASAITTGSGIAAEGTLSSDGKTLTALRITVLPAGSASGFGHGHGHGQWGGPGMGMGGMNTVPANPNATTPNSTSSTPGV